MKREAYYGRQSIAKCSSLDEQAHGKTGIFSGPYAVSHHTRSYTTF